MAAKTWQDASDNWTVAADWSGQTQPGSTDDVTVAQGGPQITSDVGTIASLANSAAVELNNGGKLNVTGAATNSGTLNVDNLFAAGGSVLTVGGMLTNSGTLRIGAGNQSVASTVNLGSLTNFVGTTRGTINLYGSASTGAALNISSAAGFGGAAGNLVGNVALNGDAQIKFASGTLNTIRGSLLLNGSSALITTDGLTNNALSGLSSVISGATLDMENGSAVTTTGATSGPTQGVISNAGTVNVDTGYAAGGSTLTIDGMLTNSGTLNIGNGVLSAPTSVNVDSLANLVNTATGTINITGAKSQLAALNVDAAAGFGGTTAGVEYGNVALYDNAQIKFTSGSITQIRGSLLLNGSGALITTDGSTNDALTGLAQVTSSGTLNLENGASVSTSGGVTNAGTLDVDTDYAASGSGLTIGGTLTNTGTFNIGNGALAAPTTVNVGAIINSSGTTAGTINITGGTLDQDTGAENPAILDVNAAAGFGTEGTLSGKVNLTNDAEIHFTSGQINTITTGSSLLLNGVSAAISSDGNDSNTALTGLSTVNGDLSLENGNSLTTTGAVTNTGSIFVDDYSFAGGSSLTVDGALTNSGTLNVGNSVLSAPTTVQVASLANTSGGTNGTINVTGGNVDAQTQIANQATLNVGSAAGFGTAGSLIGHVNLYQDGVIQFSSGQINTITSGSSLFLNGALASVTNDGNINSALTELSEIDGNLTLGNGASVTTGNATGAADTLSVGNAVSVNGGYMAAAKIDIQNGGSVNMTGGTANAAVMVESGGSFGGTGSAGTVTVASGGTFNPGANTSDYIITSNLSLAAGSNFNVSVGSSLFGIRDAVGGSVTVGSATFNGTIMSGFTPSVGDTFRIIDNDGTDDAVSGTFNNLAEGATTSFGGYSFKISYVGGDGNDVTLTDTGPVCYASGTLIRTARGEVTVEALQIGDLAVTASGAQRPIKWIGRRHFDCATHPTPEMVRPIRVTAGAFGSGKPYRDLMLSPHHAVAVTCVDEVLIPIRLLVNGSTITQIGDAADVTYWHVELDSHDILLADGLPAESYIDVGNRCDFEGEATLTLHPAFKSDALTGYCRPLITGGSVLAAVRVQLAAFAGEVLTGAAPKRFHLLADGTPIAPVVDGHRAAFVVPAGARDIRLVSPTWSPRDIDPMSGDDRRLGLLLETLTLDDLLGHVTEIPLDHPGLVAGFHQVERTAFGTWRWTDGDALLSGSLWDHRDGPFVLHLTGQFHHAATLAEVAEAA